MFAVVKTGGKQYRVAKDDVIRVELSSDGMAVTDGKITVQDLLSTLCSALGIGSAPTNMSPSGRPIPIAEGSVIEEV